MKLPVLLLVLFCGTAILSEQKIEVKRDAAETERTVDVKTSNAEIQKNDDAAKPHVCPEYVYWCEHAELFRIMSPYEEAM